jgi:hypothetical protein
MVYGSHDFNNTYTFCFPQSTITLWKTQSKP